MTKTHPETVLLLEPIRDLWRIVERKTTTQGLCPDTWREIQGDLPDKPTAQARLRELKGLV